MSQITAFPRGFLLTMTPHAKPDSFVQGPILSNLSVHPWALVDSAGGPNEFVIVIGSCISSSESEKGSSAEVLLEALRLNDDEFFKTLSRFGGTHAVIFGDGDSTRIANDAAAMQSVFYAIPGGVVASHAWLVEHTLGGEITRNDLPFQGGYPGNLTPHPRTKILTANTYLDITSNRVQRFWPSYRLRTRDAESVTEECLVKATRLLQRISENHGIRMAMTAGLDSRIMIGVGLNAGIEFQTFTYGHDDSTAVDRAVAADVSRLVGIKHTSLPPAELPSEVLPVLRRSTYAPIIGAGWETSSLGGTITTMWSSPQAP